MDRWGGGAISFWFLLAILLGLPLKYKPDKEFDQEKIQEAKIPMAI
ncbi:hypothetical protein PQG02_06585 [Nostoc sp. UHCC 0926]|nr:hypothetical protein [Nostoc sp. UHCC 0926]WDD34014.1 hypothetical protein PQG02_06585 [Nostoc sp. UHCC 0926]